MRDQSVSDLAQVFAVVITSIVTVAAVAATVRYAWNRRIVWPLAVLVSGGIASVMEPMFDHLYGLWFFVENQWTAFTTYGITVPIWLPIVWIAYYGAWTVWLINRWQRGATPAQVTTLYLASVAIAFGAEQFYIQALDLYEYQVHQPLGVAGYPIWVTFVNGVPPFLASIIYVRLIPLLKTRWESLALLAVVPFAMGAASFGSGFLYLAYRHGSGEPNDVILAVLGVLTAFISYFTVVLAGRLAGLHEPRSITPEPVTQKSVPVA